VSQSLVVVSGLSGSGKSIALKVLEDAGYYCVDNLPATLLLEVVDLLTLEAGHERIAVSVDARSASLPALPEHIERLKSRGLDCRVLYLEASTPTLLRRFSETRRRHPLSAGMTLPEAIERERTLLAGVAPLGQRIDTSDLQPRVLQNWIRDLLGLGAGALTLLFESFSYKQGIPLDADWVFDARMIANPHYDPQLRPLTGRDAPVIGYLERDALAQQWLEGVRGLLGRWLPEIVRENRSHVTVAIGCTGGRHRSVYLAEKLAAAFRADWRVLVRHRGLADENAGENSS
jgi:RNase adapter protein RapZ